MTDHDDRLRSELTKLFAITTNPPRSHVLEDMTMDTLVNRRRVVKTVFGSLIAVAAGAAIVVGGLAAHHEPPPQSANPPVNTSAQPSPSASPRSTPTPTTTTRPSPTPKPTAAPPTTSLTFSGQVSGTMVVTSTNCQPDQPAQPFPSPQNLEIPASVSATGTINGTAYTFTVSEGSQPGSLDEQSLGRPNAGVVDYYQGGRSGVTSFSATRGATFDVGLISVATDGGHGHGGPVVEHASGTIVCAA